MKRALSLSILLAACRLAMAEENSDVDTFIEYPSPDGHYVFRKKRDDEKHTVDLIEKKTGKVVKRVAESDEGRFSYSVLWAPDGRHFAMSVSTSRLSAGVEAWVRDGSTFREIELAEVAEPEIPKKYENEKRVWHWSAIDYRSPVRWTKDGSLVVECETTTDGNDSYVTAKRTVVYGFDRVGKAKILSNKHNVTAHFE